MPGVSGLRHVLLLGVPHFNNPGRDMGNVEMDDVLAPVRQRQIAAVVEALVEFRPTVVTVEFSVEGQDRIDAAYEAFCVGEGDLGRSEIEQLGYRVAQLADLPAPRGVDVMDVFYDPSIEEFVERHRDLKPYLDRLWSSAEADAVAAERQLREQTIGEYLRAINTPLARHAVLRPYIEHLVPIAGSGEYPGPEMASNWYRRNLKIAANLRQASSAGDRVMVIYGAGHIPVFEHILGLMPDIDLVDPLEYLP